MIFHRYKSVADRLGHRDVEHLMVVEVKVGSEKLNKAQRDTLSVFNGLLAAMVPVNGKPIEVTSRPGFIVGGHKKVVWHGVHLLRVPFDISPLGPFFWDNRSVDSYTIQQILDFDRDSRPPHDWLDIDRRHKALRIGRGHQMDLEYSL